ncbi:transcriptional activator of glycolytic enzymes-domain-containing protein [Dipodascopsis uninucleata]
MSVSISEQIDKLQNTVDQLHAKVDGLQRLIEQKFSTELALSRSAASNAASNYISDYLEQRRGIAAATAAAAAAAAAAQGNIAIEPSAGQDVSQNSNVLGDVEIHDPRILGMQPNVGHTGEVLGDPMADVVPQSQTGVPGGQNGSGVQNQASVNLSSLQSGGQLNNNLLLNLSRNSPNSSVSSPNTPARRGGRRQQLGVHYKMDRGTQSVDRFWEEWTIGINGSPSIQALNATFRASWRSEVAERKFYSQRLVLVRTIEWMARTRQMPISEAVEELEKRRRNENISLSRLCRILKEEESKREE